MCTEYPHLICLALSAAVPDLCTGHPTLDVSAELLKPQGLFGVTKPATASRLTAGIFLACCSPKLNYGLKKIKSNNFLFIIMQGPCATARVKSEDNSVESGSPFTFVWVPGTKLGSQGLNSKLLYPLSFVIGLLCF